MRQVLYEEINLVKKRNNYGWNVREGKNMFLMQQYDTAFWICR